MRIAMLGHKRVPSREGGVEIVVEELSVGMAAMGHSVTCYNRRGKHISGRNFSVRPLKAYKNVRLKSVITFDVKGIAAMSASFFAAICAALGKYDVVHFHAEGSCAMIWLPKLFGKRCIATIHGLDHMRCKWGRFAKWYILQGEKCAAKYADEIIVLNRRDQAYFLEKYGRETRLIPNGVNRPEIKNAECIQKDYGLTKNEYILYLGRIVPEKGLDDLVAAYKKVDTDKKLVIAGGSSDTQEYFRRLRKLAEDDERILFTGFVQGQALEELYSNAYFYVLPSKIEGMPLSLMEAMSYGNACLVSDIEACKAVAYTQTDVFPVGDVEALRAHMQQLCDDEAMVERLRSGVADYICGKYNWNEIVRETLELYRRKEDKR